jgi:uncharacterized repeat protein (TIGR01451 family)
MMPEIYSFGSFIPMADRLRALSKSIDHNAYRKQALRFIALVALVFVLVPTSMSSLDLSVSPSHLNPGGIARFTINVINSGETLLDPVTVEDTLPAGLSYISDDRGGLARGRNITWNNVGGLDVGDSTRLHLVTRIGLRTKGKLVNFVTVTGTPPTGYNVTDNDTEDIFVTAPVKEPTRNMESLDVGDQEALAVNLPGNLGAGSAAVAENSNEIKKIQSQKDCSSCRRLNQMRIRADDQFALAFASGRATNCRVISSIQE